MLHWWLFPWNVFALLFFGVPLISGEIAKHFLIVCAKVSHEEAHLTEWIEFHRIQGVEKFVLYYEAAPLDKPASASASKLLLLQEFYSQHGHPTLVEVQSAGSLLWESLNAFQYVRAVWSDYHRGAQNAVYNDCIRRYGTKSEWIMTLDADEFLWINNRLKPTVREYLQAFGTVLHEQYYRKEYPLYAMQILKRDELQIPIVKEIQKLIDGNASDWVPYAINDTLIGLVVPGISYGTGGVFWSYNNVLSRDLSTGRVSLFFDPRDNFKFRVLYNALTEGDKDLLALKSMTSWEKFIDNVQHVQDRFTTYMKLLTDLSWAIKRKASFDNLAHEGLLKLLNATDDEVYAYFDHKLAADYPDETQPLFMVGVDKFDLRSFLNSTVAYLEHATEYSSDALNKLLDDLLERYIHLWSSFYPLVIEDGVWRMPSHNAGDDLNFIKNKVLEFFPQCLGFDEKIAAVSSTTQIVPHIMCQVGRQGPRYSDVTQMGKPLYWTGHWNRKEKHQDKFTADMLFDGEFHGCPGTWIHNCGFRQSYSNNYTMSRSNPLYELRMDHHSFRSFIKRSLGLPKWRKSSALGYLKVRGKDIVPYEGFANSHHDLGASVWLPELRKAMSALHPLPRFHQKKLDRSSGQVRAINVQSYAPLGELLTEFKVQCPANFPFVGLTMPKKPHPPSPAVMGAYCVRSKEGRQSLQDAIDSDPVVCPGFPETSCADWLSDPYMAKKLDSISSYRHRNISVSSWQGANVCVRCALTD